MSTFSRGVAWRLHTGRNRSGDPSDSGNTSDLGISIETNRKHLRHTITSTVGDTTCQKMGDTAQMVTRRSCGSCCGCGVAAVSCGQGGARGLGCDSEGAEKDEAAKRLAWATPAAEGPRRRRGRIMPPVIAPVIALPAQPARRLQVGMIWCAGFNNSM